MKTVLALAVVILGTSAGDVFLTKGMKQVGDVSSYRLADILRVGGRVVRNRYFLLALASMTLSFAAFLTVLSWAELSFVVPVTSLSFVISTIGAWWFLKERISYARLAGIVLVCLGVALVSL